MYWKLIDKISGMKWESHMEHKLREAWLSLIEDYKQQGIEVYCTYQGNGVYWLDEYPIKKGE